MLCTRSRVPRQLPYTALTLDRVEKASAEEKKTPPHGWQHVSCFDRKTAACHADVPKTGNTIHPLDYSDLVLVILLVTSTVGYINAKARKGNPKINLN